ncbi:MAG: glycoside hydrolase domain-containing protein, partial [bacterium]
MNRPFARNILQILLIALAVAGCGPSVQSDVWLEDSLVKVFPDTYAPPFRAETTNLLIPRNGHASLQLVVRPEEMISEFELQVSEPVQGGSVLSAEVRYVGYVPVASSTRVALEHAKSEIDAEDFARVWDTSQEELIGKAPGLFPDPLHSELPSELEANKTESFWITFFAPNAAPSGQYSSEVSIKAGGEVISTLPLTVEVMKALVPAQQKLKVTNWLNLGQSHLEKYYDIRGDPEAYWEVVENVARVMGQHRQNVVLTPVSAAIWEPGVTSLVQVKQDAGKLAFDFSNFDRWVKAFQSAGVAGTIEGGHLLTRPKGYFSEIIVPSHVFEGKELVAKNLPAGDKQAEKYLAALLDALYKHLEEKGWLDRYIQHVHDEPHGDEVPVYERYARLIRKHLPGVPTIDAVDLGEDTGFLSELVDIWVPVLSSFDDKFELLEKHRQENGATWFYTCIVPGGRYLNRFVDQSLLKVRLLHWFNFRHNLTGYLHWGGNAWHDDPFEQL